MQTTTIEDMKKCLDALGLNAGVRAIVIHSSLMSFGRMDFGPDVLFSLIKEKCAPDVTVFVPTFTLKLTENDVFDPAETKSHSMGTFSEFVRTLPQAVRAPNPMHSYAGVGPLAKVLAEASSTLSFGPGSCFEKLLGLKPYLLLLGCPFHNGATHIHQVEAELGVPYRLWVPLKRWIKTSKGSANLLKFQYYGIDRALKVEWTPEAVLQALQSAGHIKECPAPYGKSYALPLARLDFAARAVLQEDSQALNKLHMRNQ
jgi:aminoglycoside N3'-acetyltransferase